MNAVRAIALNTFREAIRDRILYLILFFALTVILGSEMVAVLAVGSAEKVVLDLGLSAISLFGVMASVFLGLSLVSKEIERRTIYTVVSKPISRGSFVIGKLAGMFATVTLLVVAMAVVFLGFARLRYGVNDADLLKAIALTLVEDLLVSSFAILFSCFTTPILGTLFSMTVYVIGHLSFGLTLLAKHPALASSPWRRLFVLLYWLLPNLERFNFRGFAVHGETIGLMPMVAATAYGVAYSVAVIGLAVALLARRDFR